MSDKDGSNVLAENVRPREIWAWAMYDFANSGYTTVVITAIFNAYFVAVVAEGKDWGTFVWSLALAVSYVLIMATAPAVGAYADAYAARKDCCWPAPPAACCSPPHWPWSEKATCSWRCRSSSSAISFSAPART
jgi:hypothetical protein